MLRRREKRRRKGDCKEGRNIEERRREGRENARETTVLRRGRRNGDCRGGEGIEMEKEGRLW